MNIPDPKANPYLPPRAPVADVEDAPLAVRPRLVDIAAGLLVASLVVGLVNVTLLWRQVASTDQAGTFIISAGIAVAIIGWLTHRIWKGRNWARIVLLILLALGVWNSIGELPVMFDSSPVTASIYVFQSALQCAAVALVFLTPARHWFSRRKKQPE